MNGFPIIAITITLLLVAMLVAVFVRYRRKGELPETDYRMFFILGVSWLPIGIALDNPGLWGMGAVFLIAGLANRNKWKTSANWSDATLSSRGVQLLVILGLAILLALAVALLFVIRGQ